LAAASALGFFVVVEVRQSRPEERGILYRLEVDSWLDGHGAIFPECANRPNLIATGQHGWPLDPTTQFADLALVEDGKINGMVALFGQPDGYALIEAFYIRRARRQQGFGKVLWTAALAAARAFKARVSGFGRLKRMPQRCGSIAAAAGIRPAMPSSALVLIASRAAGSSLPSTPHHTTPTASARLRFSVEKSAPRQRNPSFARKPPTLK
jgi:GNAT superfamily N-acetyltransferase